MLNKRSASVILSVLILATSTLLFHPGNTAHAVKPVKCDPWPACKDDGGNGGTETTYSATLQGAFEFTDEDVTVEAEGRLSGDDTVTMVRPGDPDGDLTWHNVWDVCNIYGPSPFGPDSLIAQAGRKGWTIERSELDVRVVFRKMIIDTQISPDPLEVSLQLISECTNAAGAPNLCPPFQPESGSSTFNLTRYSNHARGKGGVTHQAECHAGAGPLSPVPSTLTITATPPP